MASHRMLSCNIIEHDQFYNMSKGSQALYFHLMQNADDDGFLANPKGITRMAGCSKEEFEELVNEDYLICFPSGVVVIKHWRVHNHLRKEVYRPSILKERKLLCWDKNGKYWLKADVEDKLSTGEFQTFDEYKKKTPKKAKEEVRPKAALVKEPIVESLPKAPAPEEAIEAATYVEHVRKENQPDKTLPTDPAEEFPDPVAAETGPDSLVSTWLPKDSSGKSYSQLRSFPQYCDRKTIPRNCSTVIGEVDVLPYDSNSTIAKKAKETREYLEMGQKGYLWMTKEEVAKLQAKFPTSWQKRLERLENHRIRRRKDFGYGFHGCLHDDERQELYAMPA